VPFLNPSGHPSGHESETFKKRLADLWTRPFVAQSCSDNVWLVHYMPYSGSSLEANRSLDEYFGIL